jgi:hypothetical protein
MTPAELRAQPEVDRLKDALQKIFDFCNGYGLEAGMAAKVSQEALMPSRLEAAASQPEPVAPVGIESYIQGVPEHCDRIVWRGRYFVLPINSPFDQSARIALLEGLLREAQVHVSFSVARGYLRDLYEQIEAALKEGGK